MFHIKNLVVEDVLKIDDLTLKDDVISIEGQSGSGKSTLLRLLNNLDDPASGSIYFNEEDIAEIPAQELRKKIVMVPQDPVMFDGSIRDNLNIGLELSGEEAATDGTLEGILDLLWLDKSLDTSAGDLSGGEEQRLSLGRVLLMEKSEALLLDEPSSALDDRTSDHVLKAFFEQALHQGQQVIMVTHNKQVSKQFADEVVNMDVYSELIHDEGNGE